MVVDEAHQTHGPYYICPTNARLIGFIQTIVLVTIPKPQHVDPGSQVERSVDKMPENVSELSATTEENSNVKQALC